MNPPTDSGAGRSDCTQQAYFSVGLESQPQILTINDQPAVLFQDYLLLMELSDPVRQLNPSRYKFNNRDPEALFLIRETDWKTFWIATKSRAISEKELIRIAGSIP